MALVALLQKGNTATESQYFKYVSMLQQWCVDSFLEINVLKTKELIVRNDNEALTPVQIHGQKVEIVDGFKYLGTHID